LPRVERVLAAPLFWGVFLVVGIAVRFRQYLFGHSYWYDEAYVVLTVRQHGLGELLGSQPYNVVCPPVYLWVTRLLHDLGGDGERWLRLPAFLAGLAALVLLIPLARRLLGATHAVWPILFLAVSGHVIDHGCEVHPYTIDLLVTELLLYAATLVLATAPSGRLRLVAWTLLCLAAGLGPWLSFPALFVVGGVSLALAVDLASRSTRREWLVWLAFNGLVGISCLLLWWFSARHLYYAGMIEHWGHRGWGGFPDWGHPLALLRWIVWRPVEIGNYGNRSLGAVLSVLAVIGAVALARQFRARAVLLTMPFALALIAALLGRFPIAHRTTMFLLPCLWLAAAAGVAQVFRAGRPWAISLALVGLLLSMSDALGVAMTLYRPDPHVDYRGAYQFVQARRQAGDLLWAHMAIVYQTYYGTDAQVLEDHQLEKAVDCAKGSRLWVVVGDTRRDVRQRLEAAGGRITLRHHVSGLDVLLFEPGGNQ
jgi:4-amino-4-deoxy-L-arabinose transferase-like glycosyltransferase